MKIRVIQRATKIVNCRYSLKPLNEPSIDSNKKIRLHSFKQFSKLIFDSSILMIISMIMKMLN